MIVSKATEVLLFAAIAASISTSASAAVLLTSYPIKTEGSAFGFSSTSWEAIGFRMGSGSAYDLNSVTMRLSSAAGGLVDVAVYSSGTRQFECGWSQWGGSTYCTYQAPLNLVGTLQSKLVSDKADYAFSANGTIALLPQTLYWIVFKGVGATDYKYYEHAYADVPYTGDPGIGLSPWQGLYSSEVGAKPFDFSKSPGYGLYDNGTYTPGVLGTLELPLWSQCSRNCRNCNRCP